ncbi:MAG TPA: hypothetical protein VFE51_01245 [Verrucomicrobiae bacterium]|nr:hypothetical protein [Verrucomicrobiae bacterium]
MSATPGYRTRWLVVAVYALAMAWVEAAVVYYLRTMVDRIEPYQPNPLPIIGGLGPAEMVREAATLIMLLAVGILAGNSWRSRLGYAAVAFGIWDIFYYVFLRVLCGWPHSLLDWDILFLLPLPWWGPVLAPVLISFLMIAWGSLSANEPGGRPERNELKAWLLNGGGIVLALGVFMADTLRVASQGMEAVRRVLPQRFSWVWFCLALVLMSAPLALSLRRGFFGNSRALKEDRLDDSVRPKPMMIPVGVSERARMPEP